MSILFLVAAFGIFAFYLHTVRQGWKKTGWKNRFWSVMESAKLFTITFGGTLAFGITATVFMLGIGLIATLYLRGQRG
jgi:ABC-type Fe3+ transport system permease subunit